MLAIALIVFVLEGTGVVGEIGLTALNLTAIGFLFMMNRTLGEMNTTLDGIATRLADEETDE